MENEETIVYKTPLSKITVKHQHKTYFIIYLQGNNHEFSMSAHESHRNVK